MLFNVKPSPRKFLEATQGNLTVVKSPLDADAPDNARARLFALATGILTGGHLAPERSCFFTGERKACVGINAQAKRFALSFKNKVKAPIMRLSLSKRQQVQPPAIIKPIVARLQRLSRAITFTNS